MNSQRENTNSKSDVVLKTQSKRSFMVYKNKSESKIYIIALNCALFRNRIENKASLLMHKNLKTGVTLK